MKIHLFDKERDYQTVPAGQTLFHEGDDGAHMYAVIGGAVDIIVRGNVVETVEAGGVFGEMALIEERKRSATAITKAETKLVHIDHKRFLNLVAGNPYFALQLMRIMAERLRRMDERL